MAQNVTVQGASYSNVPAVDLPKTGGGTARFADSSITTAVESDVANGKIFVKADSSTGTGTLRFSTIYTGSTNPPSSLGVNGDIYLKL